MVEGNLSGLFDAGKYHPDHPEENDVVPGYQYIRGIKILQLRRMIRPAQRGKRPECGRKPGVQRILILFKVMSSAFRTGIRRSALSNNDFSAVLAVIGRNPVPPPELAGNTPVLDVVQPVFIGFPVIFRDKRQLSSVVGVQRRLSHLLHADKPLGLNHRLHCCVAAVMRPNRMGMRNHLHQKPLFFQILHHDPARLIAVHAGIFSAPVIHGGIVVQNIDFFQPVPLSHLKIIRIMRGSNLHTACPELLIDILIGNDRDLPVCKRKLQHFSDQMTVSFILRIYSNGSITQKSFRTSRCYFYIVTRLADNRIVDVPEETVLVHMLHFRIGQRRLALRTPVDNPASFIDPAFFIQTDKHFLHCFGAALVHRKTLPFPVRGGSQLPELLHDPASVLVLPLPAVFQEFFSSDLVLVDPLLFQHVGNLDLCGDCRMIGSWLPESLVSLHPFEADQNILHGIVQRVAHVQLPCNIWRRHNNTEWFFIRIHLCVEIPVIHPFLIEPVLQPFWIIGFCQFLTHNSDHPPEAFILSAPAWRSLFQVLTSVSLWSLLP